MIELASSPAAEPYPQYRFKLPEGATDVVLVRHGESAPMGPRDFPRTADGQANPELSPEGHQQAQAVCKRLLEVGLEAVYASSLVRTQQTIAPYCEATGMVATIDPDLREIGLGDWEGGEFRRRSNVKDPAMMQLLAGGPWDLVPNGEGARAFADRVRAAIMRIHAAHPDQRVGVVCHGGVIGQVIAEATGSRSLAFMGCDNSAISQVVVWGEHWIVRRYNDTEHLGPWLTRAAAPLE
ncbi:MAG: histidine phosphatase family protein [Sporichthyaceae bacterium]